MAVKPIPDGYHTVTPFLMAKDAAGLIDFIVRGLNGKELSKHVSPDDKIMHCEMRLGDSVIMLGEANENYPPVPGMLYLYVEDVDSLYKQAINAGGKSLREPTNEFYGDRACGVADAFGNQWWMATHIEDVSPEEMEKREKEMKGQQA